MYKKYPPADWGGYFFVAQTRQAPSCWHEMVFAEDSLFTNL